ncbi:sulfatase [Stratiformator vulcanicus]|uniref:Arylsulfatase n=1 Tax=Stratiformator vulcanicus TaxID=2527980 RepID=A0A517R4W2_9PLAN|nr:sulfatase [Stratiformator vulcanicus]QDT38902.1 Arylsulfatase precursor [Stratiformator vulcanicus]
MEAHARNREQIAIITRAIVFCLTLSIGLTTLAADRPNIVVLLADDLGWSDLACYGNEFHETPRIDRLADEGLLFRQAYAPSPVCTPTRAAVLTGRSPARLGMTIWREAAGDPPAYMRRTMIPPVTRKDLPAELDTLAERLQAAGYSTLHVGKWHLGDARNFPENHGFDVNIGGTIWGAPTTFFRPFAGQRKDGRRYVPGLGLGKPGDYLTDRLTDEAIGLIEEVSKRPEPFYLQLWFHTPHLPIEAKADAAEKYRRKATRLGVDLNPTYAAMIASLDENVGRVLDVLEQLEIQDNTLVVFASDNGGFIGDWEDQGQVTTNAPLRSGKGSCYEGGIRVPLIVRGPDIKAGRCETPVVLTDLYPTLLSLTGFDTKMQDHLPGDGVDLAGLMTGNGLSPPKRTLYWHYPHYYATTSPVAAIREGNWKLLHYFTNRRDELFNLEADLSEQENLSSSEASRTERLRMKLLRWLADVDAGLPALNTSR